MNALSILSLFEYLNEALPTQPPALVSMSAIKTPSHLHLLARWRLQGYWSLPNTMIHKRAYTNSIKANSKSVGVFQRIQTKTFIVFAAAARRRSVFQRIQTKTFIVFAAAARNA